MRLALVAALVGMAVATGTVSATGATADRSGDVGFLLGAASPETVARARGNCAMGAEPHNLSTLRQAGITDLPDMVNSCVAALTRLGRDGALGFVRDTRTSTVTPAIAFDSGFVSAYRKAEAIPATLPAMATVKPIAARCLSQLEPDTDLCTSAGYVYGARIARGEAVPTS